MPVCHQNSHVDWSGIEPGLQPEPWHSPHIDVTHLFKNARSNQLVEMWLLNTTHNKSCSVTTKYSIVEEYEINLMSQFIKFYITSSMLNKFRTLIHP